MMQQRTARVNVSEETIQIGQVRTRFLLTGKVVAHSHHAESNHKHLQQPSC
jgi:hypothetical protein